MLPVRQKLRENGDMLDACISKVVAELHRRLPDYGRDLAIDASDMPAYANGQRFLFNNGPERERFSDPDASWGHRSAVSTRRGGGFYGYKLQAAICTNTGLPVAWQVETARANESRFVASLLDSAIARGMTPETVAMDKAYDFQRIHENVPSAAARRSSRCAERPRWCAATTARPPASTDRGASPVPTTGAALRSGAAPPASASRGQRGSRPTACTR